MPHRRGLWTHPHRRHCGAGDPEVARSAGAPPGKDRRAGRPSTSFRHLAPGPSVFHRRTTVAHEHGTGLNTSPLQPFQPPDLPPDRVFPTPGVCHAPARLGLRPDGPARPRSRQYGTLEAPFYWVHVDVPGRPCIGAALATRMATWKSTHTAFDPVEVAGESEPATTSNPHGETAGGHHRDWIRFPGSGWCVPGV